MQFPDGITAEIFLRDYWQKKPLLIRNAFPGFTSFLAPDELAGLSLEEDAESRIVMEQGPESPWQLMRGPFTEETFRSLPEEKWTLLVQAVDQWVPEAEELLEHFRFIPDWRIDDLMISYAVKGGSVGPHYDQYDVFLLQGHGKREWRTGQLCSEESAFLKEPQLKILSEFEEENRWTLEPGDMLYLPPGVAHYGIAQTECMTYSIGFRAPSQSELLHHLADTLSDRNGEDLRYSDPSLTLQDNPGEITEEAVARLQRILSEAINNKNLMAEILGTLTTEPKYPDLQEPASDETDQELLELLTEENSVSRNPASRFAWHKDKDAIRFFANGDSHTCSEQFATYLCASKEYDTQELTSLSDNGIDQSLLLDLLRNNHIAAFV